MAATWIRFKRTYSVQAQGGPTYLAGSPYEMDPFSALHFTRRGIAEEISAEEAARILNSGSVPEAAVPAPVAPPPEDSGKESGVDLHFLFSRERHRLGIREEALPPATEPTEIAKASTPDPADRQAHWKPEITPPLVSCVMPTWNRRLYISQAIESFLSQTYPRKELVIVDDGDDPIKDLVPKKKMIRYVRLDNRISTGMKRNKCCEFAKGELICHFDDDDWSAPDRVENQVKRLLESGRPITGYSTLFFWDTLLNKAMRYVSATPGYVCGTTLMFYRKFWENHRFADKHMGSDNDFVYPNLKDIASSHDHIHMVARIHDCHHTSSKNNMSICKEVSPDQIPGAFWESEKARLG
jgi:hypothetical protein